MSPQTKRMRITVDGKAYDVTVEVLDESPGRAVAVPPPVSPTASVPRAASALPPPAPATRAPGAVVSPLAGVVVSVDVTVGQSVAPGDVLVTLEAMKMKTPIRAAAAGTVQAINASPGTAVPEGATLVVLA